MGTEKSLSSQRRVFIPVLDRNREVLTERTAAPGSPHAALIPRARDASELRLT